jgi:hypothetical protein
MVDFFISIRLGPDRRMGNRAAAPGEIFFPLANSRPDEYSNRRLAPSVDARSTHPGGPSFDFGRSDKETTTRHGRRGGSWLPAYRLGDAKRMSQLTSAPETAEQTQLSRLGVSIRGKLQFMDYLIRAALADAQRYQDENDPGTRIFIRQLVEMHTANLRLESQNLRLAGELCAALEAMVDSGSEPHATGDLS